MRRLLWVIAFLLVVGGFAGFQQYSSWSLNKSRQSDAAPGSLSEAVPAARGRAQARGDRRGRESIPVVVVTAVQKAVPVQIRAVGNVEPYSTVSIKSQVTGVLQKAHFKEGEDVKKGQLLFTIDPRPFEAALKQAEANLARDNAQLKNLREQVRRYAELVEKQYVSREQYDQIKTNADAAEAVVNANHAAVENAKVSLSYCYIYAPIDGRAGSLLVNEGNLVRVNDGTPLVVINQINPINVTFAVPEQHLIDLRRHMKAGKLQVDAAFQSDEGRPERGRLEFVDNAVDRSTGTIRLKGVFTNRERRLWPGQFVNVALTLTTQPDAVVVPSEAIQVGPEGQHVFVVQGDNRVEMRPVTLGQTNEGEAIVAAGLAAGERVVREGQFLLGPGSLVQIKNAVANVSDEIKELGGAVEKSRSGEGRRGHGRQKGDDRGKVKGEKRGQS